MKVMSNSIEEYTPEVEIKSIAKADIILSLCDELHSVLCHDAKIFRDRDEIQKECAELQDAMTYLRKTKELLESHYQARQK